MKRCPQCEFIYEDEQSLCDMDGVLLVFDSRTLPDLHALATVSAPLRGKPQRRNRMAPAFATLLLMIVVGSVYYVSTTRNSAQINPSPASVTSTTADASAPAPTPDANPGVLPADEPAAPTEAREPTEEGQRTEARETEASPAPKPAAAPARTTTTKSPATTKRDPKKDESKVESILKKTGKILKKPFKF